MPHYNDLRTQYASPSLHLKHVVLICGQKSGLINFIAPDNRDTVSSRRLGIILVFNLTPVWALSECTAVHFFVCLGDEEVNLTYWTTYFFVFPPQRSEVIWDGRWNISWLKSGQLRKLGGGVGQLSLLASCWGFSWSLMSSGDPSVGYNSKS